jgi:cellulose synthase/poly-beta-1,6-N-acetylglucosamine synthase-like glycosyltransferase
MLDSTLKNPFSLENAWITFMLLSTLIPTLLHLLLGLISILLYITRTTDWFIGVIEESQEAENKRIKASAFLALPLTILSFVLFYLLIYVPISWFIPAQVGT